MDYHLRIAKGDGELSSLADLHPPSKTERTLGRVTSGTTITLRALGASLGAWLGSPPGWYRYLPSDAPVSHGMPELAMPTEDSEVEPVGDRPLRRGVPPMLANGCPRALYTSISLTRDKERKKEGSRGSDDDGGCCRGERAQRTEVEACTGKGQDHDAAEDL